jgi:hypothetical protein
VSSFHLDVGPNQGKNCPLDEAIRQNLFEMQETAVRGTSFGGLVRRVHLVPLNVATFPSDPTVMQNPLAGHEIAVGSSRGRSPELCHADFVNEK